MIPGFRRPTERERREQGIGWRMAGLGLQTSSEVIAGAAIGWCVDWYFQTGSKGLLVGAICGIVVGMASLIRGAMRVNAEFDAARRGSGPREGSKR